MDMHEKFSLKTLKLNTRFLFENQIENQELENSKIKHLSFKKGLG